MSGSGSARTGKTPPQGASLRGFGGKDDAAGPIEGGNAAPHASGDERFPAELRDDLAWQLEHVQDESALRLVRQLKAKAEETTELMRDDRGALYVRKRWARHDRALRAAYQALAGIQSPALPRIRSLSETADGIEVVRSYVPGPTLRVWIQDNGPLEDAHARSLLMQVATGVRALHRCDPPIIHRDINPNNVIMGENGPVLIDFGIARAFDADADRDTHTWGTHGYAAPEQYGFGQSDVRTDIFALGMLYWFLLTGSDPDANLHARLAQMPPSEAKRLNVSPFAREVILECVTLAPENRFSNVDALVNALQAPDDAAGATARPEGRRHGPSARWSRRSLFSKAWLIASSAYMALLLVGAAFFAFEPWRFSRPEALGRAVVSVVGVLLFFAPAWLVSANPFGLRDRMAFLKKHPVRRGILVAVGGLVAGTFLVWASSIGESADYLQFIQQHGATTV